MQAMIVYGSQYGTTEAYARQCAAVTGASCVSFDKLPQLAGVKKVVHFGGLYAGGVKGLKQTLSRLPEDASFAVVTVGLADGQEPANRAKILSSLKKQIPEHIFSKTACFHLRGGIVYPKLSFLHKTMMGCLYRSAKKKDPHTLSPEDKLFLDTYGKEISFVDFKTLEPVIHWLSQGEST